MWNSINTNGIWQGEVVNKKKNGEEIVIDASLNTFQDNNENYVLIIVQDVTQRLQSEERLIKINHELKLLNKINDLEKENIDYVVKTTEL